MRSSARHPQVLSRRTFLGATGFAVVAAHAVATRSLAATADAPLLAYVGTFSSPLKDTLPTQVDLPPNRTSGLVDAMRRLQHVPGCCRVRLAGSDIVRHPLVQRIVEAYDDEAHDDHGRPPR
jgi:hypothetical protein